MSPWSFARSTCESIYRDNTSLQRVIQRFDQLLDENQIHWHPRLGELINQKKFDEKLTLEIKFFEKIDPPPEGLSLKNRNPSLYEWWKGFIHRLFPNQKERRTEAFFNIDYLEHHYGFEIRVAEYLGITLEPSIKASEMFGQFQVHLNLGDLIKLIDATKPDFINVTTQRAP